MGAVIAWFSFQPSFLFNLVPLQIDALASTENQFADTSLLENLFQYMGIERSLRPAARSRGLSDVTVFSRRSMMSSSGVNEWEPSRQPRAPPRAPNSQHTPRLQQHEGFLRFLKQHASPPHQRVTAGGRIVPTGPLSPPPMFDYASLNGLVQEQPARAQIPSGAGANPPNNHETEILSTSNQPRFPASNASVQSTQPLGSLMMNSGMNQESLNYGSMSYAQQPFADSMVQLAPSQFIMTTLGVFPDGTSLISCNGVFYRCYWNGITTIMEPISMSQPLSFSHETAMNYLTTPLDGYSHGSGLSGSIVPDTTSKPAAVPFAGPPAIQEAHKSQPTDSTRNSIPPSEEVALKAHLANLDKHLALHHYDIGPAEKTQLVSRRKTLVEAIAKLRSNRQPQPRMIPIVETSQDGSRKTSAQNEVLDRIILETHQLDRSAFQVKSSNDNALFRKYLSPSAPAFVPKSVKESFPGNSTLNPLSKESTAPKATKPLTSIRKVSGYGLDDVTSGKKSLQEPSSSSESQPFLEVDPWDPAMKIVPPSMILYAHKYGIISPGTSKKFCTTVEEFQEAIRRVREQARMWGCVGGNSKDPAYDAEEDIWYAIKDEYPIPLPTEIPDHITCPRPWNWYDSAFNVKATIEPRINMRGDTFEDICLQPKKEATSAKYTFADLLPPTMRELEAAKEIVKSPAITLAAPTLESLSRNEATSTMQIPDGLLGQHKHQRPAQTPKSGLSGSIREGYNPIDDFGASGNQKQAQTRNEASSAHFAAENKLESPTRRDTPRAQDQARQAHSSINKGRVQPSQIALSAAQAAYSPKASTEITSFPAETESLPRASLTTPNTPRSNAGKTRLVQNNVETDNRLGDEKHELPLKSTPHREPFLTSSSPSPTRHRLHNATYEEIKPDTLTSRRIADVTSHDYSRHHKDGHKYSYYYPLANPDHNLKSPRSEDTKAWKKLEGSLSTESKGSWGPEQLSSTRENCGLPKVNIPRHITKHETICGSGHHNDACDSRFLPGSSNYSQAPCGHEVKLEHAASGISEIYSDTFLKDMLRNPRYSANFQHKSGTLATHVESLMAYQATQSEREKSFTEDFMAREQQAAEKENATDAMFQARADKIAVLNYHAAKANGLNFKLNPIAQASCTIPFNKASSSLAAPAYHAQGYLPSYDGAGKARAASIYQDQSQRMPHKKPRVHLPLSSSYIQSEDSNDRFDKNAFSDPASRSSNVRYLSAPFGYDGSEEPATDDNSTPGGRSVEKEDAAIGHKGVTTADFDHHRPDHDNEWHRGAVNDFFRDLHEKEVKKMMARQRKNIKTVP